MSARTYELIYIIKPEATEQEVAELHTQVEGIVQRLGGTIEKTEPGAAASWPTRSGSTRKGTTCSRSSTGSGELMKELDRRLKVTDGLIRHLVVRVDEASSWPSARAPSGRKSRAPPRGARAAAGAAAGRGPAARQTMTTATTYDGVDGRL
jgi:small subunit ribosomal protein S6